MCFGAPHFIRVCVCLRLSLVGSRPVLKSAEADRIAHAASVAHRGPIGSSSGGGGGGGGPGSGAGIAVSSQWNDIPSFPLTMDQIVVVVLTASQTARDRLPPMHRMFRSFGLPKLSQTVVYGAEWRVFVSLSFHPFACCEQMLHGRSHLSLLLIDFLRYLSFAPGTLMTNP